MSYSGAPRGPKDGYLNENPGPIPSDSLAAESLERGGEFGKGTGAVADPVPSYAHTATNTDTSGAIPLPPTTDARQRIAEGTTALKDDYRTPADEARYGEPEVKPYDTHRGGPQAADGGYAPTGQLSVTPAETLKPKGKNITEGGFDSDAPNASFEADIGENKDPGRLAEERFAASSARSAADAGYEGAGTGPGADAGGGKGGFERLDDTEA